MAAPHVAGTAALRLENYPSETPQQVRDAIVQHATKNVVSNVQSANNHLLYSLLNHPKRPTNLTVSCTAWDSPHLEWTASTSSDVDYYEILKGTGPDFTDTVIGTTSSTSYDDTYEWCSDGTNTDAEKYYRVRTVDTESLLSGESNFDSALITNDDPWGYQTTPTAPDSLSSLPTYEQPSPSDEVVRRDPSIRRR